MTLAPSPEVEPDFGWTNSLQILDADEAAFQIFLKMSALFEAGPDWKRIEDYLCEVDSEADSEADSELILKLVLFLSPLGFIDLVQLLIKSEISNEISWF